MKLRVNPDEAFRLSDFEAELEQFVGELERARRDRQACHTFSPGALALTPPVEDSAASAS